MINLTTLANKPLVEAIFEVRWELTGMNALVPNGPTNDPNYDVMVGYLRGVLQEKFPSHVRLPAAQVPGIMMPYQPQHQFRSEAGWPLVQLGSGVITINETETYSSQEFIETCLNVLKITFDFWKGNGHTPKIIHANLRYIDAVNLNNISIEEMLEKLHIKLSFDKSIIQENGLSEDFDRFHLSTRMRSSRPLGHASLVLTRGTKLDIDALIWETSISSDEEECNSFMEDPKLWLTESHKLSRSIFFSMVKGELLEGFK